VPRVDILKRVDVERSARVIQLEGMFDLAPERSSEFRATVELPLEASPWKIGLVVGPSGSGKTSAIKELYGGLVDVQQAWHATKSVVDGFPKAMGIKELTAILSSVGFSSPPAWLRPYHALSNGEQFRVNVARAIAQAGDQVVIDEFTSVVDRTVAKICSAAVEKAIRRSSKRLVAASCHYDIVEWLNPDWILDMAACRFGWRELQPRPVVELLVSRVSRDAWDLFRRHHYLSSHLHKASKCFLATVDGRPAAFTAVLSFPHATHSGWREHRTVCHPDFQGVGIGNRMSELVASLFPPPYYSTTSHPAMVRHRHASPLWSAIRLQSMTHVHGGAIGMGATTASRRFTSSFKYEGPRNPEAAAALGVSATGRL
jgi:ABC-type lipoprotein export system ATPase subunit